MRENALFVILLRLLEQRHLSAMDHSPDIRASYAKHFLPLAEEFYAHHCRDIDIGTAEELVKH